MRKVNTFLKVLVTVVSLSFIFSLTSCAQKNDALSGYVRVAMIDGGVNTDLESFSCYSIQQERNSDHSDHGTSVASTILDAVDGKCLSSERLLLHSYPVLDSEATGASADDIAAAIDLASSDGAQIINISIDIARSSAALEKSVKDAAEAGVVIVAAAGNRMGLGAAFPAALPEVVSIGATDSDNILLAESAAIDLDFAVLGEGHNVWTKNGELLVVDGTSFAAAHFTKMLAEHLSEGESAQAALLTLQRQFGVEQK